MRNVFMLIPALLVMAGVVLLQIFLSKKESKWLGLILPMISFGIALTGLLGVLFFTVHTGTTTLTQDGQVIEQTTTVITDTSAIIGTGVITFLIYNIPTGVLLTIYLACRGKYKKRRDLEKMSVQDLD